MSKRRPKRELEREAEWIQKIAEGDREAFENLFHRYYRRLYGYTLRMLRNREAAEELATDTLVEVWKSAHRFRGRSKVSTWIFGIAHNKARSALRRPTREIVGIEELQAAADPQATPEVRATGRELREKLARALLALSAPHREVLDLAFFHGYHYREIAEIVGCPVNTVKTRIFYAKAELQPILEQMGIHEGTP